jgi:hypothetical protein
MQWSADYDHGFTSPMAAGLPQFIALITKIINISNAFCANK